MKCLGREKRMSEVKMLQYRKAPPVANVLFTFADGDKVYVAILNNTNIYYVYL